MSQGFVFTKLGIFRTNSSLPRMNHTFHMKCMRIKKKTKQAMPRLAMSTIASVEKK